MKKKKSFFFPHLLSHKGVHHFVPTSPLRDYGDSQGNRHRRSRSASVRFVNEADDLNQVLMIVANESSFPKQTVRGY